MESAGIGGGTISVHSAQKSSLHKVLRAAMPLVKQAAP